LLPNLPHFYWIQRIRFLYQDSVDYASSLFLDSLNNEPSVSSTSTSSPSPHTSPHRKEYGRKLFLEI
jgi:hypothetical protein